MADVKMCDRCESIGNADKFRVVHLGQKPNYTIKEPTDGKALEPVLFRELCARCTSLVRDFILDR